MADPQRIFDHIDRHFEQHLERARTFVRQPSISGEGGSAPFYLYEFAALT